MNRWAASGEKQEERYGQFGELKDKASSVVLNFFVVSVSDTEDRLERQSRPERTRSKVETMFCCTCRVTPSKVCVFLDTITSTLMAGVSPKSRLCIPYT